MALLLALPFTAVLAGTDPPIDKYRYDEYIID
jgi:hypothetical protein